MFLLVGPAAAGTPAARAALRKLVRALPHTFRADAEAAADAVVVDPARWGAQPRARDVTVDLLQRTVVRRRKVRLVYRGRAGEATERLVDPWGLVDKDDVWYLVAGTDKGRRTFRVDRIEEATATEEEAHRPADFELGTVWDEVVEEMERRRSLVSAVVLIERRFVHVLHLQFGRHCAVLGERDGRARVRLAAHTPLSIAERIAGWGATLEVVESAPVRAELARIGAELTERYGRSDK